MPIDKNLVSMAYRVLLGREPESQQVIDAYSRKLGSLEELLRAVIGSTEYKFKHHVHTTKEYFEADLPKINVDVSTQQMDLLIQRIRRGWQSLGQVDPYWSVLTNEAYRTGNINEKVKKEFFATGFNSANLIDRFEIKTQTSVTRNTCFELGCGVGRVTYYLAQRFEKVIASDISEGNLRICRDYLGSLGIKNVEYLLIKSLDDYSKSPEFDFFYSIIVLQHNPPPIQKFILEKLTSKIRDGGPVCSRRRLRYLTIILMLQII